MDAVREALARLRTWFTSLPTITRACITLAVSIHVARTLAGGRPPVIELCLRSPTRPLRVLSAPVTHAGWVHLLFNAWAFAPTAANREAAIGSATFAFELSLVTLSSGLLFWALAAAVTAATRHPVPCAVGASGVIFALLQADAAGPAPPAPVTIGAVSIPPRLYPALLVAVIQLLLPGVSFVGHAAGLIAGEAAGAVRRAAPQVVAAAGAALDSVTPRFITSLAGWVPPSGHAGLPVATGDAAQGAAPAVPGAGVAARASAWIATLRGQEADAYQPLRMDDDASNPFSAAGGGHVLGGGGRVVLPPAEAAAAAAAARAAAAQQPSP